ncbi:DUF4097 family beta strand repeat-containing protein [Clostridium sporogenes]|uniref:DUF4097 family beta strand repeat-containing protein n=1 Tax=Clostridium sporogenes TaxID=1509 RepID=UPI003F904181
MQIKFKILLPIVIIAIGVIVTVSILGFKVFSSFREIDEKKALVVKEINEIQVNMVREHVHILRTDTSNEVRFHYYGKSKQELKLVTEMNNKTIVVEAKCEDNPLPRYYDPTPEDMYLDIYIPENYRESISIHLTTGAVQIDSLEVASFTLDTTTGGLKADQINAAKISIKTTTGSIAINKTDANNLDIKGTSSAVNIGECIVESAKIETTSGGIDLKNCSGSFNIKANSGKVQVSYKEFVDHNISIATSSGSLALLLPDTAEFLLEANTLSGRLKSDFTLSTIENKKMAGQIGIKNNKVVLKSSSGNISLLKNN